ncbi:MAG: TRAP transporter large permease [Azospirillaceae bacterium]
MTGLEIGAYSLVAMVVLVYAGLHVPIALALVSFVGVWILRDSAVMSGRLMALATEESISSYLFGVVPLFVLMGLVVSEADIGRDTFDVANRAFRRIKGGLGMATVGANAVFAAVTGISIASAAVFARVAVPEMLRVGHKPRFAVGVVAGSSVLGMLIPPSLLLILFAVLSEQSVGALFIAGILPGITMAVAFCLAIWLMAHRFKGFVGEARPDAETMAGGSLEIASKLLPLLALVVLVLGGIYGGWFTPTEAGAVGALGAIVIAAVKRRLPLRSLWKVTIETGHITASICFLIIAATMYSRMLSLSGLPEYLAGWIVGADIGLYGTLAVYVLIIIAMGTILDSSSIMLIVLPLVLPVAIELGIDLIWFGIITVIAVEIGLLTPPLGLSVYVIKGTLAEQDIALGDIFRGAAPFALIMLLVLILVIAVPGLSLWLL